MRPELILTQRPELRLQLSPQLIQRIEILQLSAADLQDLIESELVSNEVLTAQPAPTAVEDKGKSSIQEAESDQAEAENGPQDSESRLDLDYWNEVYRPRVRRQDSGEADPKQEALNNTPGRPQTLHDHLERQLTLEELTPKIRRLVTHLIRTLDHNGWFPEPLEEILVPFRDEYTESQVADALGVIQSLEPRGVGARSPKECLLLQWRPDLPKAALLKALIENGLDDLGRNRLPKVARDLGIDLDELKELVEVLRHEFNPFPGRQYHHVAVRRVRPDVVVEEVEGDYLVRLENDSLPRLAVDEARVRRLRQARMEPELRRQLRRDVESARWLIESIEQRKRTLERVAQEILRRQRDFLDHGINHLKPLKMQEIADELGIHVSTVSRALKGKYIQTPQGVHEMKFFFTGASRGTDGVVESRAGVKERVREIIEREDKQNPLSDEEIVERLKQLGLSIARRTVTKYRKSLGIASSRQRREY